MCLSISPLSVTIRNEETTKANSKASQSLAEVSCKTTPDCGIPELPLFKLTGEAKFWGVTVVSPNTSNLPCVVVPVVDKVLNLLVFSRPFPSKFSKSSILLSESSISWGPLGLILYTGPSPKPTTANKISVENKLWGSSVGS